MPRTYKITGTVKFTDPDFICDNEQVARDSVYQSLSEKIEYAEDKGLVEILNLDIEDVGPGEYGED